MARSYITEKYGEQYAGEGTVKKGGQKIQDAHEAIRPTDVARTPLEIKESLSRDQFRLYQLIWEALYGKPHDACQVRDNLCED